MIAGLGATLLMGGYGGKTGGEWLWSICRGCLAR